MDKLARLKKLREIAQKHAERETILFTGIPVSDPDIQTEIETMDTFMEERRERRTTRGLTSDE